MTKTRPGRIVPLALVVAAGVAAAGYYLVRSEALPSGPQDVIWDHTQCAECRMSVSERNYAAQLQTQDGRILDFDDAGCLFRFERHDQDAVHAVYFRHVREDRWLSGSKTAFIESGPSPMGYDLGAVEKGTAGALDIATVRARFEQPAATGAGEASDAH